MPKKPLFSRAIWDAIRSQYLEGYPINALASAYGISYGQLFAKKRDEEWPRPVSTKSLSTLPPLIVYKEERPASKTLVLTTPQERVEVQNEQHVKHILPTPYANIEVEGFGPLPKKSDCPSADEINKMTPQERMEYMQGCDERASVYQKRAMESLNRIHLMCNETVEQHKAGEPVPLARLDAAYRAIRALGLDKIPFAKAQGPSSAVQVINNNQGKGTEPETKTKRIAIPL